MGIRTEQYKKSDGSLSNNRHDAIRVSPAYIAGLILQISTPIPVAYVIGTADHESTFATNEIDTEPSGFISKGLYQISDDEATDVGMKGADLLDPVVATQVFVKLQEHRLAALDKAAPNAKVPDKWAYLAIGHNQGTSAMLKTIANYGLDWMAYKGRNPTSKILAYGDDVISGGSHWVEVLKRLK